MQLKTSQQTAFESFWTVTFLTLSGGFQDACTYFARGKVFANAATGNVVLMAAQLFDGNVSGFLHYLIPLSFFCAGIAAAQSIHHHVHHRHLYWRQAIVLSEICILIVSAFVTSDLISNAMVSFACAMQVQSFRKVHGLPFNSTMTIANLRNAIERIIDGIHDHDGVKLHMAGSYLRVIVLFFIGAGLGKKAVDAFGQMAIFGSVILLILALAMMYIYPAALSKQAVETMDETL